MQANLYTRFWFEFEIESAFNFPAGIGLGVGVTAINYHDAINIMDRKIFSRIKRPPFKKSIENVDINTLNQNKVTPNMAAPHARGIWFPLGYE